MNERLDPLLEAARRVQAVFDEAEIDFCFIGGLAAQHWSEPRVTRDVDGAALANLGDEQNILDRILPHLPPRSEYRAEIALVHRVMLLHEPHTQVGVDVSLAASGFEQDAIARSVEIPYAANLSLRICCAEDLVVYKAVANRAIDWHDIDGILIRHGRTLKLDLIERNLRPLCEQIVGLDIFGEWERRRDRSR
ncbi:MAG: hypothetical protein V3V20_08735 [Algisphaera sp.]